MTIEKKLDDKLEAGETFAKQLQGNKPSLIEKILQGENASQD